MLAVSARGPTRAALLALLTLALGGAWVQAAEAQEVDRRFSKAATGTLSESNKRELGPEISMLPERKGSPERGALLGALVGGVGLAIIGSQLCESGESCTGSVITFGLIGATVGAVAGAFIGAGGDLEAE